MIPRVLSPTQILHISQLARTLEELQTIPPSYIISIQPKVLAKQSLTCNIRGTR